MTRISDKTGRTIPPMDRSARRILERAEQAADPTHPLRLDETNALSRELGEIEWAARELLASAPELALRLVAAIGGPFGVAHETARGIALTEAVIGASADAETTATLARARASLASQRNLAGDLAGSEDAARAAMELAVQADDPRAATWAQTELAGVAYQHGDLTAMESAASQAVEWGARDEAFLGHAIHLWMLAAKARGDVSETLRRAELSIAWGERHGDRRLVATEYANLADLAFERGDDGLAAARYAEALDRFLAMGRLEELPGLLPGFGAIAARTGDQRTAALLEGAAEGMAPAIDAGAAGDPGVLWAGTLAAARQQGSVAYDRWRLEGRSMPLAQIVDLARSVARGTRIPPPT